MIQNRQPRAVLGLPSRDRKALKGERLLDLAGRPRSLRVPEVGTGAGGVARFIPTLIYRIARQACP